MKTLNKYPIYDVSLALSSGAVEHRGSKVKEWITYTRDGKELRILFKEGRPGTGENWAEKVTSELADLIGLPHAEYDFAYLGKDAHGSAKYCVICQKFLQVGEEFIPGNQLIEGFNLKKKFKNQTYTLDGILSALQKNKVNVSPILRETEYLNVIANSTDLFIGYLCFDAWIGNTDRHDENWGIIVSASNISTLAPTFDHGSSLGRNESDENRSKRMTTKDTGYHINAYAKRAMTPIYDENGKKLNTIEVVEACKKRNPNITKFWINTITDLMSDEEMIRSVLDKVPDQLISGIAKDFAMAMLKKNVELLRGLQND